LISFTRVFVMGSKLNKINDTLPSQSANQAVTNEQYTLYHQNLLTKKLKLSLQLEARMHHKWLVFGDTMYNSSH